MQTGIHRVDSGEPLRSGGRPRILIVDDQPENLRLLSELLEGAGYEVRPAIRGDLALQSARSAPPDLVLLDVCMPGLDGYAVCQRLRVDSVLLKPATMEEVSKAVSEALGRSDERGLKEPRGDD